MRFPACTQTMHVSRANLQTCMRHVDVDIGLVSLYQFIMLLSSMGLLWFKEPSSGPVLSDQLLVLMACVLFWSAVAAIPKVADVASFDSSVSVVPCDSLQTSVQYDVGCFPSRCDRQVCGVATEVDVNANAVAGVPKGEFSVGSDIVSNDATNMYMRSSVYGGRSSFQDPSGVHHPKGNLPVEQVRPNFILDGQSAHVKVVDRVNGGDVHDEEVGVICVIGEGGNTSSGRVSELGEQGVGACRPWIYFRTHTYIHTHIYIYIYTNLCTLHIPILFH